MTGWAAHGSDRRLLVAVATFNALAAWAGGLGMVLGVLDLGEDLDSRLPFGSLVFAGVALVAIVAIPSTVLAWAGWTGSDRTPEIAAVAGALLVGWIVVQIVVLRAFSLLQPVYLAVGVYLLGASGHVRLGRRCRGSLLVVVGAIVLAAGIGLFPRLVDNPATAAGVLALVLTLAGLGAVLTGAVHATRGLSRPRTAAALVGVVATVLVGVWMVAPPVAATHVRPTSLTATPGDLSLIHETVWGPRATGSIWPAGICRARTAPPS